MLQFKVLDRLFFKGFIGPCLLAFFIVEFVLIMQNLWKVIDNILGKGYGMMDYLELLSYFALAIIPMSLPLTVLLSSVMVYGDMAEKYELSSAKSAGISFMRLLKPGLVISIGIFFFSLLASNFLKPQANEGFHKKMRDMKTNKLTFVFDEKIFNREFKDFSIRIGKKDKNGRSLDDVLIYDHTDTDDSVVNMIRAKKGDMYTTPDRRYLVMDLKDGFQMREMRSESADRSRKGFNAFGRPVVRFEFSTLRKVFDLTEMLDLNVVNVAYRQYDMMNTLELLHVIDSLNRGTEESIAKNIYEFNLFNFQNDNPSATGDTSVTKKYAELYKSRQEEIEARRSVGEKQFKVQEVAFKNRARNNTKKKENDRVQIYPERITDETRSLTEIVDLAQGEKLIEVTSRNTQGLKTNNSNNKQEVSMMARTKARYVFKLHQMYSWALVCIIFLFIGAPAGAIVRKGGFGYPLLIAIGFYLTFVMSSIIGEKLMASRAVTPPLGAWLPCLILMPFAVYLSWRALHDNRPVFRRVIQYIKKRRIQPSET